LADMLARLMGKFVTVFLGKGANAIPADMTACVFRSPLGRRSCREWGKALAFSGLFCCNSTKQGDESMKMKIALLTSAVMMFAVTQASAALILSNGGFELPVGTTQVDNTLELDDGDGATNNWTASNQTFFVAPPVTFGGPAPLEGAQYLQLNASGGGRVFQDLGTPDALTLADITWTANFQERPSHPGATYTFGLYSDATGTTPLGPTAVSSGSPGDGVWASDTVTATGVASGTNVWAFFTAAGTGGTQLLWIDDLAFSVDVTAVPEPSSMLLVDLGILGLGVVRRRRQS